MPTRPKKRLTPAMKRKLVPWIDKLLRTERAHMRGGSPDCPLCEAAEAAEIEAGSFDARFWSVCTFCPVFRHVALRKTLEEDDPPCNAYIPGGCDPPDRDSAAIIEGLKALKRDHEEGRI